MNNWISNFWHFSYVPTQEVHCERHCATHMNAVPILADLVPVTPPSVFCSNPGLQQPTYKMPEVCPEHSWNPECTSPPTANPDRVPCAAAQAHSTPSPLAALKAAQVPLLSPDTAVTHQYHEFILKEQPQARTWALIHAQCWLFISGMHNFLSFQFTDRIL